MAASRPRSWGGLPCCQWANCLQTYPALFFLVISLTQAHDEDSTGDGSQSDINCALFRKCDVRGCSCRPLSHFCCSSLETTTSQFREFPRRPSVEPDYSGVVKLALGAAIVMLAGVILALVWNLYREKRRMARGSHSNRRNHGRSARNTRRRAVSIPPQDLPPNYNDIFIISSTEPGRRHEKPPSYEEAMRDQQFRLLPGPAYVNFGFTNDTASPQNGISSSSSRRNTCIIDMQNPGLQSAVISVPSSFTAASTSDGNLPSLNIASIIRRLRPNFAEPISTRDGHVTSYASLDSPCRRALQGLSEPSIRKEMPGPIVTVRRTKSGRAGSYSSDFESGVDGDEGVRNIANDSLVLTSSSVNSTPQHVQTSVSSLEGCIENNQLTSSNLQSAQEENVNLVIVEKLESYCDTNPMHQSALQNASDVPLLIVSNSADADTSSCDKTIAENQIDRETGTMIVSHDANTQEVPLGVLRATTAASDC